MGAMGGRHVGRVGRALPAPPAAAMGGNAAALEEDLDGGGGEADLDALVDELVRHAVVVGLHDDVVVDVHGGVAPLAQLVTGGGQRAQERAVELLEELAARDAEVLHEAVVEAGQQGPDRRVQLGHAEEALMAEGGQDPALGDEHVGLDDGLVSGPACPSRHDRRPVVLGELQVGAVNDGLVAARLGDAAQQIVGDEERGSAAEEFHHPHVGGDPRGQVLGWTGFSVHVTTRAEHADEQFDGDQLARPRIDDHRPFAGVNRTRIPWTPS
jgi:hypothetical protein